MRRETTSQIYAHAMKEFPNECCGAILTDGTKDCVRRCNNIQNERHAEDPATYPRDARTAYLMDPNDLIKIHREVDTKGTQIKAFYHSHPNEDAYFSDKDKTDATEPWGLPNYPDTVYVVISLYDRQINVARAYSWDDNAEDFVEVPINSVA
ncbi:MAG: M67 family metallopeptidase [Candidatus Poribacteria bacterium]|nr:M67 family metallopeptidase [Candidatus Poribacteria bacterium]